MENRGRKLSEPTRTRIRQLLGEGMSVRRVARVMQVAASTVQRVRGELTPAVASSCAAEPERHCVAVENCVVENRQSVAAPQAEKCLTKRTESSSNVAARWRERWGKRKANALGSSFGFRHSSLLRRAYLRVRCGLRWGVLTIRALQKSLLTKRTRSGWNDAALREKPPDREATSTCDRIPLLALRARDEANQEIAS